MGKELLQKQTKLDKRIQFKIRLPTKCLLFQLAPPPTHTYFLTVCFRLEEDMLIHYHGTEKLGLYSITLKSVREKGR